jgi:hypothetical protein
LRQIKDSMKLLNDSVPEAELSQEFRYRTINLAPNPII